MKTVYQWRYRYVTGSHTNAHKSDWAVDAKLMTQEEAEGYWRTQNADAVVMFNQGRYEYEKHAGPFEVPA